jgi:hypothetical protein
VTTSTVSSTTLMAVSSSIAYAGPGMPDAHRSAPAMEQMRRSTVPKVLPVDFGAG